MASSPEPQHGLHANRGYRVLVANVVLALLATFAVVLRIVARRLKKVAGADDIAIIIALVRNESTRSKNQRADAQ